MPKMPIFRVKSVKNYTGHFFYTDISVVSVTNMRYAPDPLCGKTLLGRVNIQQSAPPIVVTEDAGVDSKDDNGDELS